MVGATSFLLNREPVLRVLANTRGVGALGQPPYAMTMGRPGGRLHQARVAGQEDLNPSPMRS